MFREPTCSLLCVVHLLAWVMGKHESLHMHLLRFAIARAYQNAFLKVLKRTSLAVQWLRPCFQCRDAEGMGSIPSRGTKILHAVWHSQKNFFEVLIVMGGDYLHY